MRDGKAKRRARIAAAALGSAMACTAAFPPSAARADDMARFPKIFRFEEDYRYLADPGRRTDVWDPIKYIPLSSDGGTYLSLGGELRERYEYFQGGFARRPEEHVFMHRLLLHADLHLGDNLRTFVQFGLHGINGRKGRALPTDVDGVDVQQAFVDLSTDPGTNGRFTLRGGRQEMMYGTGRFVSIREGPNIRLSFDGVRGMYRSESVDLDVFATRPVAIRRAGFDDVWDTKRAFWGLYGTWRLPVGVNVDLYYFGDDNDRASFLPGIGQERRHTTGTHVTGKIGAFDYNLEAAYQFGRFDRYDISAFGLSTDVGWTLASLPFSPRIGVKANLESGDGNPFDRRLGTFNPLFPNHAYFSEAAVGAPMNDIDIQPNVVFHLTDRLTYSIGYDTFWRHKTTDAVYTAALTPIPGTAAVPGRYVGNLITNHLRWQFDRHWEFNLDYTRFTPSKAMRAGVNAKDVDFAMASVAYKF